ncbi:hypothetical protein [Sporosarcina sp. ZBG7A]|uniref:hypothetical protein n=1 Tax=Sporosarcina sp. ZBG7A TaxID=1582223 RepID=UPI00057A7C9E|nr:hypothetical protein [Sporosarcina sp. ZBG7A]
MNSELELSRKSKRFLEDLRVYLITSRKSLDDVNEIINGLENHLYEAERNGKPIERIVGRSPGEYMEMVSGELTTDNKNWFKYICLIIFGSLSFMIFPDIIIMGLNLSYTILEIVSRIVISVMFILFAFVYIKYTAIPGHSVTGRVILLLGMTLLFSAISFIMIYLNGNIDSPIIHFGTVGTMIVAVVMIIFLIGLVVWAAK